MANLETEFKSLLLRLPAQIGATVVAFTLENWRKQGYLGNTLSPWLKRKDPTKWGQSPPRNGRNTLVDSGALRRSIAIKQIDNNSVTIGTDLPYAQVHNEGSKAKITQNVKAHTRKLGYTDEVSRPGSKKQSFAFRKTGETKVKAHTRTIQQNIPKRQFIGKSQYLDKQIQRLIEAELLKIERKFN